MATMNLRQVCVNAFLLIGIVGCASKSKSLDGRVDHDFSIASVVEVNGNVFIKNTPAEIGQKFGDTSTLVTSENSSIVIQYAEGGILKLRDGQMALGFAEFIESRLSSLPGALTPKTLDNSIDRSVRTIHLKSGDLFVNLGKLDEPRRLLFHFYTKEIDFDVQDGMFVLSQDKSATIVTACHFPLELRLANGVDLKTFSIAPGKSFIFKAGESLPTPLTLSGSRKARMQNGLIDAGVNNCLH